MQKNNVVSFVASKKTQDLMSKELEWCKREKTPQYAKWQAKDGDTVITLYESGKVVFQGKDADLASDFWLETEKLNGGKVSVKTSKNKDSKKVQGVNPKIYYTSSIGSDEVGTGDYFGPIVVTACYVKKEDIELLENIGVKDSKKLTDNDILNIVPKFINQVVYESIILNDKDYNCYYSKEINMNKIKAILHNKVLSKIKSKVQDYEYIIIDEFAKRDTYFNYLKDTSNVVYDVTFFTRGEDKHLSVAAASLISRYIFIKEMDKISNSLGINIQKGAGDLATMQAKEICDKYGFEKLREIAKLNFKNTEKIKGLI